MMKMEMCLLMNQADIYGKGPLCISFPEGKGMLMKKCMIWIIKKYIWKTRRCARCKNIPGPLTDNLKSRDASASKNNGEYLLYCGIHTYIFVFCWSQHIVVHYDKIKSHVLVFSRILLWYISKYFCVFQWLPHPGLRWNDGLDEPGGLSTAACCRGNKLLLSRSLHREFNKVLISRYSQFYVETLPQIIQTINFFYTWSKSLQMHNIWIILHTVGSGTYSTFPTTFDFQ